MPMVTSQILKTFFSSNVKKSLIKNSSSATLWQKNGFVAEVTFNDTQVSIVKF